MPTIFTDNFDNSANDAKQRANLQSVIDMRFTLATGTEEEALAAVEERARFVESTHKRPEAAASIRQGAPKPGKVENFHTLKTELGEEFDFTPRLQAIMESIDNDFPELDTEDRLFLKQDILGIFTPPKQRDFCEHPQDADNSMAGIFTDAGGRQSDLHGVFAKESRSGPYHVVISIDPGTVDARTKLGDVSENADKLYAAVKSLYQDVNNAGDKYDDLMEERREAEREARRRAAKATREGGPG